MMDRDPDTQFFLLKQDGFSLVELLVAISILGILFAIVGLSLQGVGSEAESEVNNAELSVVQAAVDIYMADGLVTSIPERIDPAVIESDDGDAPFNIYLRSMPTKCLYTWTADGTITQDSCP